MARGATTFRPKAVVALGDSAVLIEFADTVDLHVNGFIQRLALAVHARRPPWIRDVVPALASLALHLDAEQLAGVDALQASAQLVDECIAARLPRAEDVGRLVEVPVCYDPACGLDLPELAERTGLAIDEIARRHAAGEYRVLMVGFAPGHPYLSGLDAKLAVPRRATPRAQMPAGSVAIANDQCVLYPYAISGGWSVVGRTPLRLFDAQRDPPSLLAPGDRVRFFAVDRASFDRLARRERTA
jgi:KipI family sensor histidine kinase inhibitor